MMAIPSCFLFLFGATGGFDAPSPMLAFQSDYYRVLYFLSGLALKL
jgi:hypothetical protein